VTTLRRLLATFALAILLPHLADAEAARLSRRFDWHHELNTAIRFLETSGGLNPENCASSIDTFADRLERLPSDAFAPHDATEAAAVAADAPSAFHKFFRVRLLLKKRLDGFATPSRACVDAIRRGLRVARFAEDYLADWLQTQDKGYWQSAGLFGKAKAAWQSDRLFGGGAAQVEINPAFRSADLRTGDVLLMRGPRFRSALIARSGDEEGDFSHLAIVGEDSLGRMRIVESLVEKGVTTIPLDEYLESKKEGRVVLLRYHDPRVARAAGQMIYARAQAALDAGSPIPFNFRLNRRDHTRLFCAQAIEYAYQLATGGRVDLPKYPSTLFKLKQTPIYSALGIKAQQTFAPSDIEIDPRFEVVAEWRNPKYLRQLRHSNVVLTKLLEWIRRGYSIRPDPFSDFVAGVILHVIEGGGISEDGGLPNKQGIALLTSLGRVASALVDAVAAIDERAEAESGHALTFRELARQLENIRLQECGSGGASAIVQRLLVAPSGDCLWVAVR